MVGYFLAEIQSGWESMKLLNPNLTILLLALCKCTCTLDAFVNQFDTD